MIGGNLAFGMGDGELNNHVGNLAGNAAENLVGNSAGKYSILKPIPNGFSHMTQQIEALQDKNIFVKF